MIKSFKCKETYKLFRRQKVACFSGVEEQALKKLLMLEAAESLNDLRIPPANRLEKLKGRRAGQYSIRINDQWRICFRWINNQAHNVEIVDYH